MPPSYSHSQNAFIHIGAEEAEIPTSLTTNLLTTKWFSNQFPTPCSTLTACPGCTLECFCFLVLFVGRFNLFLVHPLVGVTWPRTVVNQAWRIICFFFCSGFSYDWNFVRRVFLGISIGSVNFYFSVFVVVAFLMIEICLESIPGYFHLFAHF